MLIDYRRQSGGCGLVELESAYNAAAVGSSEYIKQSKNSLSRLVQEYGAGKPKYSLQKEDNLINIYEETGAQNIKNQLWSSTDNEKTEELLRKAKHGKFYWHLERPSVAKEKLIAWLCSSGLKGEMEGLMIAAQDQALMQYHQRNIMMQPTVSKCRMWYKAEEPIKHCCRLHNTCTI